MGGPRSVLSNISASLESTLLSLTAGNSKLFQFYFKHLLKPFTLPLELYDDSAMGAKMAVGKAFVVTVEGGKDYVESYESEIKQLTSEIHGLEKGASLDSMTKQIVFWLIRFGCVACAFSGSFKLTFLVSLLQFAVLPYSLFVAVGYGLETVFVLYTGHTVVFPTLKLLLDCLLPAKLNVTFTIHPWFLLTFLIVDQLLCAYCLFKTPKGNTAPMSKTRILQSVWYGFLNCKTYYLVLLPLAFGLEVSVLPWMVDAALGLSTKISNYIGRYWQVLFYHVHRIGHIRHVYPDAHKFHHHLHDCTAFDAHIFGSGAPEEWLILMSDIALVLGVGCIPASLSHHVLNVSWYNKWGFHSRSDKPAGHADNFHADHHAIHVANFGFSYPFEMLMKTTPPKYAEEAEFGGYDIKRVEDGRRVKLQFTPLNDSQSGGFTPVKRGHSGRNLGHGD